MKVINKCKISEVEGPTGGYKFNAEIYTSVDGGKNFYYCGNGRYFKTFAEAQKYAEAVNN